MAELRETEYDPFTGITKQWYFDGDDIVCHKTWDERELINLTKKLANETVNATFINNSKPFHRMAVIPPIVIDKILKDHNLNLMGELSPADETRLKKIIELEYPWCKTHTKKLWRPHGTK